MSGPLRVRGSMTVVECMTAMTEGWPGPIELFGYWFGRDPAEAILGAVSLDCRGIYGDRIWDAYQLCGKDFDEFRRRVLFEPNELAAELGA